MIVLDSNTVEILIDAANRAMTDVLKAIGSEHAGKGACVRAFFLPHLEESYIGLIDAFEAWVGGKANVEKQMKYHIVSMEKAIRLASNRGHSSSWETRDPPNMLGRTKFGGAVLTVCRVPGFGNGTSNVITSTSGLNEEGDEAVSILMPAYARWTPRGTDVMNVLSKSQNEIAGALFKQHATRFA